MGHTSITKCNYISWNEQMLSWTCERANNFVCNAIYKMLFQNTYLVTLTIAIYYVQILQYIPCSCAYFSVIYLTTTPYLWTQ